MMNLFKSAPKVNRSGVLVDRVCANPKCKKHFKARKADVDRGWAKCCGKSCAATQTNKKTGNYQRYCAQREQSRRDNEDGELFFGGGPWDEHKLGRED